MTLVSAYLDGDAPHASVTLRLRAGVFVGSLFIVFVPVLAAMWWLGGREFVSRDGTRVRVDLLTGLYPLAAVLTGALFYGLTGIATRRYMKAVLGFLAFLPGMLLLALPFDQAFSHWTLRDTWLSSFLAMALGCPLGWHSAGRVAAKTDTRIDAPAV